MGQTQGPHPYASFVHRVAKPARYLGGEYGAVKKPWESVAARICLAFPDIYDIGMSHLGFKILYKILNDDPRTLAERCYVPWVDMQKELMARKVPLVSLESARPLSDFDVVGFSLQFELTYTNILTMLDLGGIPLLSHDRTEAHPLILAGGPTATHPEPVSDFIDAVVIGDGEERTTEVALLWTSLRAKGGTRREWLTEIAKLRGVYVPSLYATKTDPDTTFEVVEGPLEPGLAFPVERTLVADLNAYPFPDDGPVGGPEAIFDRMSIEIARGCTEGCRFCQAGMIYRPVRERDPQQIIDTVVSAVKKSGYDEVSLTSLSTADYSCIAPLIQKVTEKLAPEKVSLGVSSLRAYGLEENVLDDIQRVRASGVTFAPEAGSQRMRDVVNKNVTEAQLMETADRVFSRGWNAMKLYFMIGLPTEEETDVREIVQVGKRARDVGRKVKNELRQGPPTVTVSVSTHVPKPHTPFQWCAMNTAEDVREKQGWLLHEVRGARGVTLRMHDSRTSWLEGVFARGDRKLGKVLLRAYQKGARFDSWEDQLNLVAWEDSFTECGVDPKAYLGTIPVSARLPWDHISVGLEEGFLAGEYRKALKSRLSPPCGKVAGAFVHPTNLVDAEKEKRKLVCYDCGVACDLSAMRTERFSFLTKLGAETPRAPSPKRLPLLNEPAKPAVSTTIEVEGGDDAQVVMAPKVDKSEKRKKAAPPKIVQGVPRRYRFFYEKCGASSFLSHLDMIRALPRAFRRIGLQMYYTSGFHPKPDMSFGPALQLGVSSVAEVVDIKLTEDFTDERLVALAQELTLASAEGVRFLKVIRLGDKDASASRIVDAATYAVAIPRTFLAGLGGDAGLSERVDRFRALPEAFVVRRMENVGKKVDVRDFVRRIEMKDLSADLSRAGVIGDFATFEILTDIRNGGGVRASEVVECIFGMPENEAPHHAVRTRMGSLQGETVVDPTDLDTIRAIREARDAAQAAVSAAEAAAKAAAVVDSIVASVSASP